MRIKTLHVQRYGPLSGFGPHNLAPFSLVHGPNERGKTLLIDAVLRMLFKNELGRRVKFFGNIHRVEEKPEGYIVLDIAGEEIKLERDATLSGLIDIGPSEFRNIFVVRDSDLSIDSPGAHFTRISEKLAGLQSSRILNIKKALQKKGKLTNPSSSAGLASSADTDHIGQKVKMAAECLEDIDAAHDSLKRQDFDALERALLDHETKLVALSEELDLLGKAKTHKRFEAARGRLEALDAIERDVEACRHLSAEDLESWKRADHDLKRLRTEIEEQKREEERLREQSSVLNDRHGEIRRRVDRLKDRVTSFDERLAPMLDEQERLARLSAENRPRRKVWLLGVAISSALLAVSLVAVAVDPALYFGPMAVAFFISLALSGWRLIAGRRTDSKLAEVEEGVRQTASRLGIEEGTAGALGKRRHALGEELLGAQQELEQTSGLCIATQKEMESCGSRAEKIRGEIRTHEGIVEDIRRRSSIDTVDEMDGAIKKRTGILGERKSLVALLSELTGARDNRSKDKNSATDTSEWRRIIADYFNRVPEGAVTLVYDESRERTLQGEFAALNGETAALREKLDSGRDLLRDLEGRIRAAVPADGGNMVLRTAEDLVHVRKKLKTFIARAEDDKQNALAALKVFEEIEAEEKSRVLELFGADANVSKYFSRITKGRYSEVAFDLETTRITAIQPDGKRIDAENLSGGALDQLRFAIRLSIGERLFPDGKGLLILDDPFIKSDPCRLETQINLLRGIVAEGWQVIYVSAKEEIKSILAPDVASGTVGIFEVGETALEPAKTARTPGI